MPTIEVDIVFFLLDTIVTFLAIPFILIWVLYKAYKNPEWSLKLRKIPFVYIHLWNGLNQLVTIVLPLKDMDENGQFRIMKGRRYYWMPKYKALPPEIIEIDKKDPGSLPTIPKKASEPDPLKDGLPTTYTWKNKTAALYEWDDPMPQVRVPGGSLHSMTNPKMLDALGAAQDFKLMLQADSLLRLLRMSIFVAIASAVILSLAVGFGLFTLNTELSHNTCILSHIDNSTAAAILCH